MTTRRATMINHTRRVWKRDQKEFETNKRRDRTWIGAARYQHRLDLPKSVKRCKHSRTKQKSQSERTRHEPSDAKPFGGSTTTCYLFSLRIHSYIERIRSPQSCGVSIEWRTVVRTAPSFGGGAASVSHVCCERSWFKRFRA